MKYVSLVRLFIAVAITAIIVSAIAVPAVSAVVEGSVLYRERITLSQRAIVTVRIESDKKSLVAETRFATGGRQVPLPFKLHFLMESTVYGVNYVIKASISADGKLLYAAEEPYLPSDSQTLDIVVKKPQSGENSIAGKWALRSLNGKTVRSTETGAPYIILEAGKDIRGDSGVNHFTGKYTVNGSKIKFSPGAMTMKAGSEPMMKQERDFLKALKSVTNWRITNDNLELFAGTKSVARFWRK